jgi:formylglycine-generating enzyme required for sulfatase activity
MRHAIVALLFCLANAGQPACAAPEPKAGTLWLEPGTRMEFVWVPAGCFQMGGDEGSYEQPYHKVCLQGFWMGKYEVTQSQYQRVMGKNPSRFPGLNNPVESVSWSDAFNFAEKMSAGAGIKVRLPSEAEWEYACRAGRTQGRLCGENDTPQGFVWFRDNSLKQTHPVGQFVPNRWGLYDMSGSVWEWVQDCWHQNYQGAPADGSVWNGGECGKHIIRGGSWCNDASYARAAFRYGNDPDGGECSGFRVVRTPQ